MSCYVVMLAPVLGFLNIYFMRYSFVADHYQYLSIIAIIALLTAGGARLLNKLSPTSRTPHRLVAVPLIVALCALTWRQAAAYENVETLWRDTLQKNPGAWIAHSELAAVLVARGDVDEAAEHYEAALALNPDAETYNNLGGALLLKHKPREALEKYREALRLDPEYAEAHVNIGLLLRTLDRSDEALQHFRLAAEYAPEYARARIVLANALVALGRGGEALDHYRAALKSEPDNAETHRNLALALASQRRFEEAVAHFRRSLEIEPDAPRAHYNLGGVLKAMGRGDEALPHFREALRLNPDWPEALTQAAWILACDPDDDLRDPDEAVRLAERATTLTDRADPRPLDALAAAYAAVGRFEDAANTCLLALSLADAEIGETWGGAVRRRLDLYRQGRSYREKPRDSTLSPFNP